MPIDLNDIPVPSVTEHIFQLLANLPPGSPPTAVETTGRCIAAALADMPAHERNKFLSGVMLMMNDLRLRVQTLEAAAAGQQRRPPSSIIQ